MLKKKIFTIWRGFARQIEECSIRFAERPGAKRADHTISLCCPGINTTQKSITIAEQPFDVIFSQIEWYFWFAKRRRSVEEVGDNRFGGSPLTISIDILK